MSKRLRIKLKWSINSEISDFLSLYWVQETFKISTIVDSDTSTMLSQVQETFKISTIVDADPKLIVLAGSRNL